MGVVVAEGASLDDHGERVAPTRLPRWFEDRHGWLAAAVYLAAMLIIDRQVLGHMSSRCSCAQSTDPTQWMWSWTWIPHALLHGENPFTTNEIYVPGPIDLSATTFSPTTAVLGSPLSWLFGTQFAYNVVTFSAPVINGWAAYRLCRYVSRARWASILAGYLYGFSAAVLAQQLGHINLIFAFTAPMLILTVLRFVDGEFSRGRTVVSLVLLIICQLGISTEMLFNMTYLGALVMIIAYICAPAHRRKVAAAAMTIVLAYVIVAIICCYPLYEALKVPAIDANYAYDYPADLMSFVIPNELFRIGANRFASLASEFSGGDLSEQNTYLGLPLVLIVLVVGCGNWRDRTSRIIGLGTLVAFILSLGTTLTILGHPSFRLPYDLLAKFPLFKTALPIRLGVFVALGASLSAALWIGQGGTRARRTWRWLAGLVAVALLVPNLGYPNRVSTQTAPAFFRDGTYKRYLSPNEVVLTLPWGDSASSLTWQAQTNMYFKMASGYLVQPPASYTAFPIASQLADNTPSAGAAAELRTFTRHFRVGAILTPVVGESQWFGALRQAGWRPRATSGGITVYDPA